MLTFFFLSGDPQPNPQYHSPRGIALREGLPEKVLAVAVKNAKRRFYIPSTENYFGGIQYDYVMIDNGCNSFLLPFPTANPDALRMYEGSDFSWEIAYSQGTGAVHSPTLQISRIDGLPVGDIVLAGLGVVETPFLRFHLGSAAASGLIDNAQLSDRQSQKLRDFLLQLGDEGFSAEREHVLLGQLVLSKTYSVQAGKMILITKKGYLPVKEDLNTTWSIVKDLEKPEGFDDLDDADHDGDWIASFDDDDYDSSFFIDEPGY